MKISNSNKQQIKVHKFGIDIFIVENEDIKLSTSDKLIISEKAKEDFIYNCKTDEEIRKLSDKY